MPSTSERTFGNRLEQARKLQTALGKMISYAPDNPALTLVNFETFLTTVEHANDLVASAGQALAGKRSDRRQAYFGNAKEGVPGLATLAGRVRDAVGAMPGGKKSASYKQVQKLVQKISNYRQPRKAISSSPPDTNAQKKEISRSEASYGSLLQAGRDLAAAVAKIPGYNPTAADIKPAALTTAMQPLADHNKAVAEALVDAGKATADRSKIYEADPTGLRSKFQQAKAAVASQFGRRSAEYKSISGITY
jgi:hypothetical protein